MNEIEQMTHDIATKYGQLLGRPQLAELLRLPTPDALRQLLQRGSIALPAIKLGKRVSYAARDVAQLILSSRR